MLSILRCGEHLRRIRRRGQHRPLHAGAKKAAESEQAGVAERRALAVNAERALVEPLPSQRGHGRRLGVGEAKVPPSGNL